MSQNNQNDNNDGLAEYRRDPPPYNWKPSSEIDAWIRRHRAYMDSPNWRGLHRFPGVAALWGYNEDEYRSRIKDQLLKVTCTAQRRLTQDEMNTYLTYVSAREYSRAYDRPVAITATLFLITRGWSDYDFLFFRPSFNPLVFPNAVKPLLKGSLAAAAWQGVRCSLYAALGLLAYSYLAHQYNLLMYRENFTTMVREPRLQRLVCDLANNQKSVRAKRRARTADVDQAGLSGTPSQT